MTRYVALGVLLTAISLGMVACEVSMWNECRDAGHSWYYCVRVLSK